MDYPFDLVKALKAGDGVGHMDWVTPKKIEDLMHAHLSGLQQQVVLGIYRDGKTFAELGKELHMKPAAIESVCVTGVFILEKYTGVWRIGEDGTPSRLHGTLHEDILPMPCSSEFPDYNIGFLYAHLTPNCAESWFSKLQRAIDTLLPPNSNYQSFDELILYNLVNEATEKENIWDCLQLALYSREHLVWFLDAILDDFAPRVLGIWYSTPLLKELVPADKLTKLSFWAEYRAEELMTSLFTEGLKEHILRHYNDGVSFETLDKEMIVEQPMSAEQCVEHGLEILKHYGYSYLLDGAPPMQPSAEYIFRLGVGDKVYNTIYENIGDVTVQQMSEFSAKELLAVDGLGKVAVQRIARILEDLGYGS